jgi:hypothetical protein
MTTRKTLNGNSNPGDGLAAKLDLRELQDKRSAATNTTSMELTGVNP